MSGDMRIAFAFISGYNAMQAVQAYYPGPLDHHPLASIVSEGATVLALPKPDVRLGLALRRWEDWGKYHFEPSPVSVDEALAWAGRVHEAAVALQTRRG